MAACSHLRCNPRVATGRTALLQQQGRGLPGPSGGEGLTPSARAVSPVCVESGLISARTRHRVTGLLRLATVAAVVAAAPATGFPMPASAQPQRDTVQRPAGPTQVAPVAPPPG